MIFNWKNAALCYSLLICLLGITPISPSMAEDKKKDTISENIKISDWSVNSLSEEELSWLRDHKIISVALDPGWPPVEFTDEKGNQSGMSLDYLKLVEQRLGVKFERVQNLDWSESYSRLKRWEIDMTTSVAVTPQRAQFWSFTKPYMSIPIVIATQSDVTYISNFQELAGRKVAMVEGYAVTEWITEESPQIQIVRVRTALEGLEMLQRGEVFAYIDNLLIIGYYQAKMRVSTIKIAGQTPYVNNQCMAVRKDWEPLARILQKALESISETERNEIYRRWLPVRYEHGFNYRLFWQVLTIFAVIVTVLIIWNRQLAGEIRSRKQAEEESVRLGYQLQQAQKMESIGRLAGGVAHDFNNMLTVILGNAEMALDMVQPEEPLYEELTQISMAAKRSADLTRQLLAFARKQTITPKVLDLNETLEGMLKMLRRLIGENIELIWLPGSNISMVIMDPSQIDQILANLCVNSKDAIDGVGRIIIETANVSIDDDYCSEHIEALAGEHVRLTVSDNGCGMGKEVIQNLFEPFFTTKKMGRGTGLGLATVYGIVRQNNGSINVYSEPGQGTTFNIYLPRHLGDAEAMQEEISVEPSSRGSQIIMLVEDEPAILNMGRGMLESLGYNVIAAHTPNQAIRLAEEHKGNIDLLITDVVMPEMNGSDLAEKLLAIHPGIRSLFMSGYTANVIAHNGVLDEGVHFIQKPFSKKELAIKVREVMLSL